MLVSLLSLPAHAGVFNGSDEYRTLLPNTEVVRHSEMNYYYYFPSDFSFRVLVASTLGPTDLLKNGELEIGNCCDAEITVALECTVPVPGKPETFQTFGIRTGQIILFHEIFGVPADMPPQFVHDLWFRDALENIRSLDHRGLNKAAVGYEIELTHLTPEQLPFVDRYLRESPPYSGEYHAETLCHKVLGTMGDPEQRSRVFVSFLEEAASFCPTYGISDDHLGRLYTKGLLPFVLNSGRVYVRHVDTAPDDHSDSFEQFLSADQSHCPDLEMELVYFFTAALGVYDCAQIDMYFLPNGKYESLKAVGSSELLHVCEQDIPDWVLNDPLHDCMDILQLRYPDLARRITLVKHYSGIIEVCMFDRTGESLTHLAFDPKYTHQTMYDTILDRDEYRWQ